MEFIKVNIFNIIGVISLMVGVFSFLDGKAVKKSAKNEEIVHKYLFDIAEKNIDKKVAEENISELKQIESELTNAIDERIPILAKKTSLINGLKTIENNFANDYIMYLDIQQELKKLGSETADIPKEISDIVVKNILPEYYRRKQKEKNFIIIAILFFCYVIVSNIPILSYVQFIFAIFMYKPLVELLELTFPKIENWRLRLKCFYIIIISVYSLLWCYSSINFSYGKLNFEYEYNKIVMTFPNIIFSIISLLLCFLISISIGLELKLLIGVKISTYIKISLKRKIFVYLLYYLFWIIVVAITILFSLSVTIRYYGYSYGYPTYIIFEYPILYGCIISGIVCFAALIIPVLPSKFTLKKRQII